jgi:parallel beta-helix repeat protein
MARKTPEEQWLGAMTTVVRNRIAASQLFAGDHIWNTTVQKYQVWNGFIWVDIGPGGGGGGQNRGEPEITVGNLLMGDTLNDCDFLDPGNGSGIALALGAAPPIGVHIYVRRGPYSLIASLNVPANIDLQGSGHGTIITAPAGAPAIIVIGTKSSIRGLKVGGIRVNASETLIEKNTITGSPVDGIRLNAVNTCIIEGNVVEINAGDGINLSGGSNENKVSNNTVRLNTGRGIRVAAPTENNNILIDNILKGNGLPQLTNLGTNTENVHNRML